MKGNRWLRYSLSAVMVCGLLFTACYTVLKHPQPIARPQEDEQYEGDAYQTRCTDCHIDFHLNDRYYWGFYSDYYWGHERWYAYYGYPWWYDPYWYYWDDDRDGGGGSGRTGKFKRRGVPEGETAPRENPRFYATPPVYAEPRGPEGPSTGGKRYKVRESERDTGDKEKTEKKTERKKAGKRRR